MSSLMTTEVELHRARTTEAPWNASIPLQNQWELQAFKSVFKAEGLRQDWDSYGSPPPTLKAVNKALGLLRGIADLDLKDLAVPFVVPVPGGGLQLEWNVASRELELEVLPNGSVEYAKAEGPDFFEEGPAKSAEILSLLVWLLAGR